MWHKNRGPLKPVPSDDHLISDWMKGRTRSQLVSSSFKTTSSTRKHTRSTLRRARRQKIRKQRLMHAISHNKRREKYDDDDVAVNDHDGDGRDNLDDLLTNVNVTSENGCLSGTCRLRSTVAYLRDNNDLDNGLNDNNLDNIEELDDDDQNDTCDIEDCPYEDNATLYNVDDNVDNFTEHENDDSYHLYNVSDNCFLVESDINIARAGSTLDGSSSKYDSLSIVCDELNNANNVDVKASNMVTTAPSFPSFQTYLPWIVWRIVDSIMVVF